MKRKHLFITASLSILLGLGVAAGASTFTHTKPVEKVEAATNRTIRVFVNLTFGNQQSGTINNGTWTSGTSTTLSDCNYVWQTTTATAGSTNNTFNMYFRENNYTYWHPYSGSKDWNTNYSTIATNLKAGHSYTVTGIGYEYGYDNNEHKWFHFTVTDLGSISDTTTVYFDPGTSYSSYSTPYAYYTEIDGTIPTAWHGTAMTKVDNNKSIYGGYRWKATVVSNAPVLVFNNNASAQSPDLTVNANKTYLLGTGWVSNLTLTTNVSSTITTYHIYSNVSFTLPALPSAPTGYTAEWNTASDGSGTKYSGSVSTASNLTLYAYNRPTVYTITYDRNKSTGLQATQNKNYGTNVNAYTPGSSPLTATGWNPSPYRNFIHWNTQYDDKGTSYPSGATISTNASFYLYYIEDWYGFRYRVDSGSWVTLVHNDDGKGAGVEAQFAPSTAQTLPLHGKLSFEYSANGSTWTTLSSVTIEGNYNSSTGINLATIDTIFLKYLDGGTFSCWVPGISDRTIAVFDSSSATTGGTPYTMRGNGDNETVTTMDVPIDKGQFVKRGYDGDYTYGSYYAGGTGTAASCFSQVGSDTAVECIITGVYTVYNQKGEYNNWKDIYFTRNEEASAALLARKFNDIVSAICTDIVSGTKTLANLQAVWGNLSTTTLYKHFHGQISATMDYFKTSSTTSDTDILECVERYDYIIKKYGTTALPDFIGRNNGYTPAPSGLNINIFNSSTSSITGTTTIIVISSITALSVGGYFFIRKKKNK